MTNAKGSGLEARRMRTVLWIESVAWRASRGRLHEARALAERTGVEVPHAMLTAAGEVVPVARGKASFAGLFSGACIFPTVILGLMSATGLVLVYSLNTWLPELMLRAGFDAKGSLSFLLVLNGGSLLGALATSGLDAFRCVASGPGPVHCHGAGAFDLAAASAAKG